MYMLWQAVAAAIARNRKVRWRALAEEFFSCRDAATVGARCRLRLTWMSSRVHALCPALSTTRCVEISAIVGGRPLRVPIRLASDDWYAFVEVFQNRELRRSPTAPNDLGFGGQCRFCIVVLRRVLAQRPPWRGGPYPAKVRQMRRVFERNGVAAHIVEGAATVEQGRATLYLRGSTCHSLLQNMNSPIVAPWMSGPGRFRSYSSEIGWDTIDLLKLDSKAMSACYSGARTTGCHV